MGISNVSKSESATSIEAKVLIFLFSLFSILALARDVFAAQVMEVSTTRYSDGKAQQFSFQVYRDGLESLSSIQSNKSEKLPDGSQLYSNNAGENLFFIPANKEGCLQFKDDDFSRAIGSTMMKLIDRFDVSISDPVLKKTYEANGGTILGYQVRETHWELTLSITFPFMFKELTWDVKREVKLWQTESKDMPLSPLVVQPVFPKSGFDTLDNFVERALIASPGFPLRSEFTQTIDAPIGSPPKLRLEQSVLAIDSEVSMPTMDFIQPSRCKTISSKELKKEGKDIMWMLYGKPI